MACLEGPAQKGCPSLQEKGSGQDWPDGDSLSLKSEARSELELTGAVDGLRDLAEEAAYRQVGDTRLAKLWAIGNVVRRNLEAQIAFLPEREVLV